MGGILFVVHYPSRFLSCNCERFANTVLSYPRNVSRVSRSRDIRVVILYFEIINATVALDYCRTRLLSKVLTQSAFFLVETLECTVLSLKEY